MKYYLYKLYFLEKIFLLIISKKNDIFYFILKEKIVFLTKFITNSQIDNYTLSLE